MQHQHEAVTMRSLATLLALQPIFFATAWTTITLQPVRGYKIEAISGSYTQNHSHKVYKTSEWAHYPFVTSHFLLNEHRIRREILSKKTDKQQLRLQPLSLGAKNTYIHDHTHDDEHSHMPPFVDQLPLGPFFDIERSGNVTALVGRPAKLNCRVNQIGNRTVSWLRDRDTHLLTVGRYTYTSDQRFRAEHIPGSEDWPLTVKFAQVRDSGMYECQVSTTPPMRHYIWLEVVEPRTRVLGGPDVYINRGSSINLTCVVDYTPQPPAYVIWQHNNKVISYDSDRGGVSVVTEKGPQTSTNLLVRNASERDSGTYSCSPSSAPTSSITVHILNGEHPAAMQHGGHSPHETSLLLAGGALFTLFLLQLFATIH